MLIKRISFISSGFLLVVLLFLGTLPSQAYTPRNNLMINTMAVLGGNYGPEYEMALGNRFGIGIRANYIPNWEAKGGNDGTPGDDYDWIYNMSGTGAGMSFRFYPFGKAPKGFHLGPRFDFIQFTGTYEDKAHNADPVNSSFSLTTAHVETGYKFIIADRLVLGIFADAGYVNTQAEDASELFGLLYIIGGGFYVGFAF